VDGAIVGFRTLDQVEDILAGTDFAIDAGLANQLAALPAG